MRHKNDKKRPGAPLRIFWCLNNMQKHGKMDLFQAPWRKPPSPECSAAPQAPPWPRAQSPRAAQQERCRAARLLRGPEVPAVLPRLVAAAGPAQASPRPPAHVGPQPRLLPSSVLAVGHAHPGQRVFSRPVAGFSTTHMSGSKCKPGCETGLHVLLS